MCVNRETATPIGMVVNRHGGKRSYSVTVVGCLQVLSKAINTFGYPAPGAESRTRNLPNTRQECQPPNALWDGRTVCAVGLGYQQKNVPL
jgi:hypothetical protein